MGLMQSRYDPDNPLLRSPDAVWVKALQRVRANAWVSKRSSGQPPYHMYDHVYLGDEISARRVKHLQKLGITHVLNCACNDTRDLGVNYEDYNITAKLLPGRDAYDYNMMDHYPEAKAFIQSAKESGGKVLVHCVAGINRSGAITLAYMIDVGNMSLLDAMGHAVKRKGLILTNQNFQGQLVSFARKLGKLKRRGES